MTPRAQVLWSIAHHLGKQFSFWYSQQTKSDEAFVLELESEWRAACVRAELQEEEDLLNAGPEEGADNQSALLRCLGILARLL